MDMSALCQGPLPYLRPVRRPISKDTATDGIWLTETVDLSSFAGQQVKIDLVNQPTGWSYEAAYWAEIRLASE